MYLDVFLAGSKTDQYNQCGRKRLMEIGGDLRPIKTLNQRVGTIEWDPKPNAKLPTEKTRSIITWVMEKIASGNDINPSRIVSVARFADL